MQLIGSLNVALEDKACVYIIVFKYMRICKNVSAEKSRKKEISFPSIYFYSGINCKNKSIIMLVHFV